MSIVLRAGENVFFPAPYVEGEYNPLIITSERLVQVENQAPTELELRKVTGISRSQVRPLVMLSVLLVCLGLPLVGYAAYLYIPVRDLPSFKDQPPPEGVEAIDPAEVRIKAIVIAVIGGLLIVVGAKIFRIKRYLVTCHAGPQKIRISAKDEGQQTQILMTIQAAQKALKQMAQVVPPQKS